MAVIELDVAAPPAPPTGPPIRLYRPFAALAAVLLALVLGGAAPVTSTIFQHTGSTALPSDDTSFQLIGGRLFTAADQNGTRITTAWSMRPFRELWTLRTPVPDQTKQMVFGGWRLSVAGDAILIRDGRDTTVVDAATGAVRWRSPVDLIALPGSRIGVVQVQYYRPDTVYRAESGDPGLLYVSSTGEVHTEPPQRTELRGVDLATGRSLWTSGVAGSVNALRAPGDVPALLVVASDRLRLLSGETGQVLRERSLPRIGGRSAAQGEPWDDLVLVRYGTYGEGGPMTAYDVATLAERWTGEEPASLGSGAVCAGLLCNRGQTGVDVIDPRTGEALWHSGNDFDLVSRAGYVVQTRSMTGRPKAAVDARTGAVRVNLQSWSTYLTSDTGGLVLSRTEPDGRTGFGVLEPGRTSVQLLGLTDKPVSDCASDERSVVCRSGEALDVWSFDPR